MFDDLKCKLGFHKPVAEHYSFKHRFRTTNKGRSKKRYYTGIKGLNGNNGLNRLNELWTN